MLVSRSGGTPALVHPLAALESPNGEQPEISMMPRMPFHVLLASALFLVSNVSAGTTGAEQVTVPVKGKVLILMPGLTGLSLSDPTILEAGVRAARVLELVGLEPGTTRLRLEFHDGRTLEKTVVVGDGNRSGSVAITTQGADVAGGATVSLAARPLWAATLNGFPLGPERRGNGADGSGRRTQRSLVAFRASAEMGETPASSSYETSPRNADRYVLAQIGVTPDRDQVKFIRGWANVRLDGDLALGGQWTQWTGSRHVRVADAYLGYGSWRDDGSDRSSARLGFLGGRRGVNGHTALELGWITIDRNETRELAGFATRGTFTFGDHGTAFDVLLNLHTDPDIGIGYSDDPQYGLVDGAYLTVGASF
jgi:hypothetical protein